MHYKPNDFFGFLKSFQIKKGRILFKANDIRI